MGPWAHRKLFSPPAPCFPYPRLSHRTAEPPRARMPHGLRAKPLSQVAVLVCSQVPQSHDPWASLGGGGQGVGGGGGANECDHQIFVHCCQTTTTRNGPKFAVWKMSGGVCNPLPGTAAGCFPAGTLLQNKEWAV